MAEVAVADVLRQRARAAGVESWIDGLGDLIAGLAADWSLTLGQPIPGGTESYVIEATMADETPAVLKVIVPHFEEAADREMAVLRLAGGEGCARLYRGDSERRALLIERLGRSLDRLDVPVDRRHEILCRAVAPLWRPVPESVSLPTGAEKGRWLIEHLTERWERLGRPCSERSVDYAVACAQRRIAVHDEERAVLVHGDVHQWNTLEVEVGSSEFKLVDPDGLRAEPEYDLGVLMREDPVELLTGDPFDRAHRLAALTGTNAQAIWEWGAVERVSTGLLAVEIGLQPEGDQMLTAAERVAGL